MRLSKHLLIGLSTIFFSVFIFKFDTGFSPETSSRPIISRTEAEKIARDFIKSRNLDIKGFKSALTLNIDTIPFQYLQKTFRDKESIQLIKKAPIRNWYFKAFSPGKGDVSLLIDIESGAIDYFNQTLQNEPEKSPLLFNFDPQKTLPISPQITSEEIEKLAKDFVKERLNFINISEYKKIKIHNEEGGFSSRNSIVWEKPDNTFGEAQLQLTVKTIGREIEGFNFLLRVPENAQEELEKTFNFGFFLKKVTNDLCKIILIVAILLLFPKYNRKDNFLNIKVSLIVSMGVMLLFTIVPLNELESLKMVYNTDTPYTQFYINEFIKKFVEIFENIGLPIFFTLSLGISLIQEENPGSTTFLKGKKPQITSKILFGYYLALGLIALQIAVGIIGQKYLGVWMVRSAGFMIYSHSFPVLSFISMFLTASIAEEISFRFFGIALIKKYLKNSFLAILISSILWGFLHSDQPVIPGYFTGIDITITGIILGYSFIKKGLLVCLTAHYLMNAFNGATFFFNSDNLWDILSGILLISLPLFIIIWDKTDSFKLWLTKVGYERVS